MAKGGWIAGNYPLTQEEMEHNAREFALFMLSQRVRPEAIAGLLANMQSESTINPGRWENGIPYAGGYGLVQWTPYTKYADWYGPGWLDNGVGQCKRLIFEAQEGLQWFANPLYYPIKPPITFSQYLFDFKSPIVSPGLLAEYFEAYYEHPLNLDDIGYRRQNGNKWYQWLVENGLTHPSYNMPFLMLAHQHNKGGLIQNAYRKH